MRRRVRAVEGEARTRVEECNPFRRLSVRVLFFVLNVTFVGELACFCFCRGFFIIFFARNCPGLAEY